MSKMKCKLFGIEEKQKKDNGGTYQIFHMLDVTTKTQNVIGNLVLQEYVKEPPVGVKIDDFINLEYKRNGKFFETIITPLESVK